MKTCSLLFLKPLQTGGVLAVTSSNLIAKETESKYSHGAVKILGYDGIWYVIEAEFPKVRRIPYDEWLIINKGREITEIKNIKVKFDPNNMIGDWYQTGAFINKILWKLFGKTTKLAKWIINRDYNKQEVCFELQARTIGLINPHLITGIDFEKLYNI